MASRVAPLLAVALLFTAGVAGAAKPNQRLSDELRGQQLYNRHCAMCHGEQAAGDGPVAAALVGAVPDLRGRLTDDLRESQVDTIEAGRGLMPSYSLSFGRYDARRVWRHMQRLSNGEASEADTDAASDSETEEE